MERTLRRTDGLATTRAPADVELLAWLLDNSILIPGTRWRVGLDALVGLVPGVGDVVSGLFGLMVVGRAAQLGLPRVVLARMLANVALDFAFGSVPLAGDAFDAWYKAHARNVNLIRRHLDAPRASTASHWLFFAGLLAVFVLLAVGIVWLIGSLLGALFG
ncbi:MAG TPA: DUF4112 domain-containing protein [Candidatus Limnocylindria bacterium]|nr:DUF4112 domain-containing protein [Candidatus Limnocylindria bacterium]